MAEVQDVLARLSLFADVPPAQLRGDRAPIRRGGLPGGRARPPQGPQGLRPVRDPRRRGGRADRGRGGDAVRARRLLRRGLAADERAAERGRRRADDAPLPRDPGARLRAVPARAARACCTGCSRPRRAGSGTPPSGRAAPEPVPARATTTSSSSAPGRPASRRATRSPAAGVGNHALLSADDAPGGMFRRFPIFERLISWTKPDAPCERETREYECYDNNSLVADEPEARGLVAGLHGPQLRRAGPRRDGSGARDFAERAGIQARYGCRWTGTRREEDGFVLETTDGEYRCRDRRLRDRDDRALDAAAQGRRARDALRRHGLGRVVPRQARRDHREAQLGLRARVRAPAVGAAS